ncbi:MAG: Gfo/Idh/MocA family oxidoreductase [Phycisphaerae bacterium]|jgi:predicted dehydrogenase
MVRVALVGFTGYGHSLARQVITASAEVDCRLVAAADNQMHLAPRRAAELKAAGVELFDDALKMFADLRGKCEAVCIATGINSHAPLTIAALKAGYFVHLEKPPAATVQEVDQMLEVLETTGLFCQVGFQAVHGIDLAWVKDKLVAGALGKVRTIVCRAGWPRDAKYYARTDWAGKLRSGRSWVLDGPAMNALAHQTNNMMWMASSEPLGYGTPVQVRAELYAAGPVESHNTAAIEIRTAEGPTAYFLGSHTTAGRFGPIIEVQGERARLRWEYDIGATIHHSDGRSERSPEGSDKARERMIANFIQAVRTRDGSILRCPLAKARSFVLALNGAHESSGEILRIDEKFVSTHKPGTPEAWTVVDGMDELLIAAAAQPGLLSDLPNAPSWARKTQAFDLAGYKSFPQRFKG